MTFRRAAAEASRVNWTDFGNSFITARARGPDLPRPPFLQVLVARLPSRAQVAQLVEQWIENPCVGGSIPPLGTIPFKICACPPCPPL